MCGIIGHVAFNPLQRINQLEIEELNHWHAHRGPDEGGVFVRGDVALGARRLSIIDPLHGHQPMSSADGHYTIVFNGEIYNHHDLRVQLKGKGHSFKTSCDTEVFLYAFIDLGPACLDQMNGMFAVLIWDHRKNVLFAARDRLGIKPLYYALDQNRILFSSELRAIIHSGYFDLTWDMNALSDYLAFWYVCQPRTVFTQVKQLPAGHFAWIEGGKITIDPWWQMPAEHEIKISFKEACIQFEDLLKDSVRIRLQADVNVGLFLSGGIDSGLFTAIASKQTHQGLRAFSIGFKERSYNELPLAQLTASANGVELHTTILGQVNGEDIIEVISKLDEPLGNASFVPAYFLSKFASGHVKSVLSGDGGDELFGGYPTYQAPYYHDIWQRTPAALQHLIKTIVLQMPVSHDRISFDYRLKQLMKGIGHDHAQGHYIWRQIAGLKRQQSLMRPEVFKSLNGHDPQEVMLNYFQKAKKLSIQNQLMFVDLNTYLLDDHLRKTDRMGMACGLEVRLPFLDYRMVEFALGLPARYKVDFRRTKIILKQVARPYLPQRVLQGPKKGLTSPIAGWLHGPLRHFVSSQLRQGLVSQMFDEQSLTDLIDEHQGFRVDHSRLLWALLTLNIWSKELLQKVQSL